MKESTFLEIGDIVQYKGKALGIVVDNDYEEARVLIHWGRFKDCFCRT